MTGKQNLIFLLGVLLIGVNWFFGGQWKILWDAVFTAQQPPGVNFHKQGLCPPGYTMVGGVNGYCVKNGQPTSPGSFNT